MTLSWFSSLFKDYLIYAPDTIGHPGYSAETRIPVQDESSSSKSIYRSSAGMVVGVPIASFIAGTTNLQIALAFFAVVNILVLIATLVFVPSIPVKEKISYGKQLNVLRKSITWFSIIVVILLNAAIFGVYSYLAEYLQTVTNLSPNITSLLLFLYGANIIGNILAGRLLTYNPLRTVVALPFLLGITYVILFFTGHLSVATAVIILIWGIVSGVVSAVFIFLRNYKYRFESTLSNVKN